MYLTIYIEINVLCCLIVLLIVGLYKASHDQQVASLTYTRTLWATFAILLADIAWALVEGRGSSAHVAVNYIINMVYLFLSVLISYLWLQFVLYRLHKNTYRHSHTRVWIAVPLFIMLFLCISAPWTHWLFYITPENVYVRGPLVIIQHILAYGYLFAATAIALLVARKETDRDKRSEALTLAAFAILPAIGALVAIFIYGLPLLWPCTVISELLIFMSLQSRQISTDELTGLNNRRQFDAYLLAQTEDRRRVEALYMLLIDLDKFKSINDTYGHLAGDEALTQAASILKRVCSMWDCFLARYGGDEFAIVCKAHDPTRVSQLKSDLTRAFSLYNETKTVPYTLSISIGTGAFSQSDGTTESLITIADADLYAAKSREGVGR